MNMPLDVIEVFPWDDNLATGIESIDTQHQTLVRLLNELTVTLVSDEEVEITRVFDELAAYASYHFESEEAIWRKHLTDDELVSLHKESHASFLPKVFAIKEEQSEKSLSEVVEHVVMFLIRWLAFHIIDSDKRLAIIVRALEQGANLEEAKRISQDEMSGSARVLIDTVLKMYNNLSSRTLDLMRERIARMKVEKQLKEANQQLAHQAITDELTGLYNRRHFDEILSQEYKRAFRKDHCLTLILLDVDHFKLLNDNYGHGYGDEVLQKLGQHLKDICRRPGDFAFRVGGEEFAVLVSDETAMDGRKFADMICQSISGLCIKHDFNLAADHLTVSAGCAALMPTEVAEANDYLVQADRCLYAAKKQGRNCVVCVDPKAEQTSA
ncbi:MAG: bacteriohemerythrin [Magnetovibrio sp.]|nr:bacteriohemerythrin [Magnetovibrio sp.]